MKKIKIILVASSMLLVIGNKAIAQGSDSTGFLQSPIMSRAIPLPSVPPNYILISGAVASACNLPWGGTITSGNTVVAYQSTVSSNCSGNSQSRVCTNGSLSGSYLNSSCQAPPTPPTPPTPPPIPWYVTNARDFNFSSTGGYYSPGVITVNSNGAFSGTYKEGYCIYQGANLQWDGASSCLYQGSWYPNTTAGVTFVYADFGFSGNVSITGYGSGSWYRVGGGASGVISFSPSSGGISGQFSNSAGASINYSAY